MRFLVDECCHRLIAVTLREAAHDVLYIAETARRLADDAIAALAVDEDRIIVTADYDFGELAIRHSYPMPGVILLAPSRNAIQVRVDRLVRLVAERNAALLGALTMVEDDRLRVRPLTRSSP